MSSLKEKPKNAQMDEMDMFNMANTEGLQQMLLNPFQTTTAIIEFVSSTISGIVRLSCVNGELIFRRNFGIRYFNLYLYVAGTFWFWLFASGWLNLPRALGFNPDPLVSNAVIFTVIGVLFFSMMFYHLIIRKFQDLDLSKLGSYDGDPLPFLYKLPFALDSNQNPKEYFVRQVYEPLFIALLALVFMVAINPQTGTFLLITSLGFALKEMIRQQKVRNMILDQVDADIIARNMKLALKGESPRNTQGVYISGLPNEGKLKDRFIDSIKNKDEVFTAQ